MHIILYLFYIGLLLLISCDYTPSTPSVKKYFELAKLTTLPHYKIKSKNYTEMGEWGEEIMLKVSKMDYIKIESELRHKPFFVQYDSTQTPNFAYGTNMDNDNISEVAFYYKNEVLYERFNPSKWDLIRIILKEDSVIILEYINL